MAHCGKVCVRPQGSVLTDGTELRMDGKPASLSAETRELLLHWAEEYNDPKYFAEDPIIFPKRFAEDFAAGRCSIADVEIAALFSAHLAWGRRAMIVRDCGRLFDEMCWRPLDYVLAGDYRNDSASLHRTIRWSEIAGICSRLRTVYGGRDSIEGMSTEAIRCEIFGQRPDVSAPNKKIRLMFRWMVRRDGKVDLGLWKRSDPADLVLPLDVHVHTQALAIGLTERKCRNLRTALEITATFNEVFPGDPCKGDFALFGYGVTGGATLGDAACPVGLTH
ncbi:MAG: DUF2400 domain-containing protein [Bacteroidales bacterium]|nr:DUF2400 domain-containing protein [Bacteroidales bacterium]